MKEKTIKVKDVDINSEFGLPIRTIQLWKNRNGWRLKVYEGLKRLIKYENQLK